MSTRHGSSVQRYIEVVDAAIVWNQVRGQPGSGAGYRRRLAALRRRVEGYECDRADTAAPLWAHRLEMGVVRNRIPQLLLPEVLDVALEELREKREQGDADPGVWAPLDRASFEGAQRTLRLRERVAEAAVLAALDRYAKKPSNGDILEAVRALEDLHETRVCIDPIFSLETLVSEGTKLAEAVVSTLPVTARYLISRLLEESFRSELEGVPIDQLGPRRRFWHHEIPGLGIWCPVWQQIAFPYGSDTYGIWFVDDDQATYERWFAEAEAERARQRQESDKKRAKSQDAEGEGPPARSESIATAAADELNEDRSQRQEQPHQAAAEGPEPGTQKLRDELKARREDEEKQKREARWAEEVERQELLSRKQEKRRPAELKERSRNHRLRVSRVESAANRDEVRRFLKSRGLRPSDLTPQTRASFRRQFRS